jgi:S1-C subfamily serine protease
MKKSFLILLLSVFVAAFSHAQEGMWLMSQLNQLNLQQKGIKLQNSEIYNPDKPSLYNAIVQVGGGTGSFVSPEGLIITNHHVAFTALQRASNVNNDYLEQGFTAWNKKDEIQAPGYQAKLLSEMKDVTQ